jgi:hypothetical protein
MDEAELEHVAAVARVVAASTANRRPIDWKFVEAWLDEITRLDPAALARALVAMGLRRVTTMRRGSIAWWPPEYQRHRPWRRRLEASDTVASRGLRAGAWSAEAIAEADRIDAIRREEVAARNRERAASLVLVLLPDDAPPADVRPAFAAYTAAWRAKPPGDPPPRLADFVMLAPAAPPRMVLLDAWDMAWRSASGGAHGDSLMSLGAFRWGLGSGRAAARLARELGYRSFPHVGA